MNNAVQHEMFLVYGRKKVQVQSLAEASKAWRHFVEENGLGASEIPAYPKIEHGPKVYHLSYNGKVWEGNPNNIGTERPQPNLVYNPYGANA